MLKDDTIRRYSPTELAKLRKDGASRTDHARLDALSEAELERGIAADPDWRGIPANWTETAEAAAPLGKKLISLRLDTEIIDWFRAQGPGYQTRINSVLDVFVKEAKKRRG